MHVRQVLTQVFVLAPPSLKERQDYRLQFLITSFNHKITAISYCYTLICNNIVFHTLGPGLNWAREFTMGPRTNHVSICS